MYRGSTPRIVPIIIIIVVVALVIAGLVAVGRMVIGGTGDSSDSSNSTASISKAVLDTTAGRSVRWTVRGPIVADEDFRSYQITVGPSERTYIVYSGYLERVISSKTYGNNTRAYEEFVYALDNANISKMRSTDTNDLRGVCATGGIAYRFETLEDDEADQSLWSSTCSESKGSMASDPLKIHALFVNQIPDFESQFNSIY